MERSEAAVLLDVSQSASPRQVRSAFRKRVRLDHPDRSGRSGTDFQRLVEARDLLLKPVPKKPAGGRASGVASTIDLREYENRPVPKKRDLDYGFDPNAWSGLPEKPITPRPAQPVGRRRKQRGAAFRIPLTTIVTLALIAVFIVLMMQGFFSS